MGELFLFYGKEPRMKKQTTNEKKTEASVPRRNKLIIAIVSVILLGTIGILAAIAFPGPDNNSGGTPDGNNPITGEESEVVYYYKLAGNNEMLLTLRKGWKFNLAGPYYNKSGSYTLTDGNKLTLDFVRDDDGVAEGVLDGSRISLVLEGQTLIFKLKTNFTVTFNTNGGGEIEALTVLNGTRIPEPTSPVKDGYTFGGWYSDEALTKPFDFETVDITGNTVIDAKWNEN